MKIVNCLSKKIKKSFLSYSLALILNPEKKVCTKMANFLRVAHDFLQRFLDHYGLLIPLFPKMMFAIANYYSKQEKGYLIIDDTTLSKPFIKLLAGAYTIYNTAMGRPDRGFNLVIMAWSNGKVTIPLCFNWYFHSDISGEYFRTKTELAIDLINKCIGEVSFTYILFDGHYSTIKMLKFLISEKLAFTAKIPCNRKAQIGGKFDQIRHLCQLKLMRNERSKATKALYHGMDLHFSVHKRKKKTGEYAFTYIVSNINLHPKTYLKIYEQRWRIEEMFRTMKQLLGFAHCQSIELQKQKSHIFSIFFSYSFLESVKYKQKLKNPEAAAMLLRGLKLNDVNMQITAFGENFQCFA